jgi:hypothetical protein
LHRIRVRSESCRGNNAGVKIAISAFCLAKGHLDVDTEAHGMHKTLA